MRINTGEYRIDLFDRYGAKIKRGEMSAKTLEDARTKGEMALREDGEADSFIVTRQIFNSLDNRSKW